MTTKTQNINARLRELGFKLANAERYGTQKDISGMKNAHRILLNKYYYGDANR